MTKKLKSREGKIEEVILAEVLVDSSYQRDPQRHVQVIAENFDPAAVGTGTVGQRSDGKLYWIDGLQRCTAMRQLGLTRWRCTVIQSPGAQYEAHIFRLLNAREGRKPLNHTQMFKAALVEQEPVALAVNRACLAAGLTAKINGGQPKGWPIIACNGLLLRCCKSYGENVLTDGLKLLVATWPGVHDALNQTVVGGLLMTVYNYGSILDRPVWVEEVGKLVPRSVVYNTAGGFGGGSVYALAADQMIRAYNKVHKGGHNKKRLKLFADAPNVGKSRMNPAYIVTEGPRDNPPDANVS